MLSKTCEYAVRATLVIAAETDQGNRISLREIARKIDSPESFTAKILQKLARNNIVDSLKGNGGGFFVSKEKLIQVTLSDIILAIDGEAIFKRCSLGLNDCSEIKPCPFHNQYKPIREQLKLALDSTSLADLVSGLVSHSTFLKT
ncbi:MAG: Rrf2 family transcriptional regulator [Flavobacteriales bacterium]|uniref:Rrf2 family transcriptional regulator n=1 Tax=Flavobacterium piscinae TaxID=2506424 RepID=A0A4Q1KPD4_9FLAO|nr:Rrf2 family transcriptional regulator [Flavobacterium piscinae]MBC8882610.1 Rrf2 family transcriptional regulator [Flavobacterium piscinae]MBN8566926.1 Rrf2 family transcriptional regulator [Flavobacteriales bacterium]RXR31310.1 Rrf2 family transcriptional regulator [Flavobacterium piscinae]